MTVPDAKAYISEAVNGGLMTGEQANELLSMPVDEMVKEVEYLNGWGTNYANENYTQ